MTDTPSARRDGRPFDTCAVADCNRITRPWSNHCSRHAQRIKETRSPHGRKFRAAELAPLRALADHFLTVHSDHPATVAAVEYMRTQLTPNRYDTTARRHRAAIETQMRRLRDGGAEPREMLLRFLTVAGRISDNPHAETARDHPCAMFNLGRYVLLTTPLPKRTWSSGRRESVKLNASVCETLGQSLMDSLAGFQLAAWRHIRARRQARENAMQTIREAITEEPFGGT